MIDSFNDNMSGTVQYDGASSDPFPTTSIVKPGCVLAPILFGIFFSLLLRYAFSESKHDIFLLTRSDGKLLIFARLSHGNHPPATLLFAEAGSEFSHTFNQPKKTQDFILLLAITPWR
jgi:hypothetical protein